MNFLDDSEYALQCIVDSIRLDDRQLDKMKSSFRAITNLLANDKRYFAQFENKIEVYAQGSASLGTTIKTKDNIFDLDIVLHISDNYVKHNPGELYNNLLRVFKTSEIYKDKCMPKNRCIQIKYKDGYHLDVLPGFSDKSNGDTAICIPDRQKQNWSLSNPKGYTEWFLGRAGYIVAREDISKSSLNTKEFDKTNIKPLKDAVMVLKMYRNECCEKMNIEKTPSIILTTLVAESYKGAGTILGTLKSFVAYVRAESRRQGGVIRLKNPVLPKENFSERWEADEKLYTDFLKFLDNFEDIIADLATPQKEVSDFALRESVMKSLVSDVNFSRGMEHFNSLSEQRQRKNDISVLREMAKPNSEYHKPYLPE